MIQLPRRSVTRFFIPLIDVLTLMFCIFLLMPIIRASSEEDGRQPQAPGTDAASAVEDRQELERLRQARIASIDVERLALQQERLSEQVEQLRQEKVSLLSQRLAIRVLEIGEHGELFFYDPARPENRRQEITSDTVHEFIEQQRQEAGKKELYILFLYPRPATGRPTYPLRSQREQYDRWFAGVAHGYDIAVKGKKQE